jgi:hypothetical protein
VPWGDAGEELLGSGGGSGDAGSAGAKSAADAEGDGAAGEPGGAVEDPADVTWEALLGARQNPKDESLMINAAMEATALRVRSVVENQLRILVP